MEVKSKYEEIINEIKKDFKKKSTIKRIQNNIDSLKDTNKSNYQKFYFILEPALCYYNINKMNLNNEDINNILVYMYHETINLFNYGG